MRNTTCFTTVLTGILLTLAATLSGGCSGGGSNPSRAVAVANAGPDQHVTAGQLVTLNGSASQSPTNALLMYQWTLTTKPVNSAATLANPTSVHPTFTADFVGIYVVTLTVIDGTVNSQSDAVVIEAQLSSFAQAALQAYVKASNTGAGNTDLTDQFGRSVALSGDTLAVGARGEDSAATGINGNQNDDSASSAGAVYVFTRTAGVWSQQAYVKASNTGSSDQFGYSVALSGDTLAVGARGAGTVYVFTRTAGVWSQQASLKASNTMVGDGFGESVALFGDTLTVGAIGESSDATGINGDQTNNNAFGAGAVYVFTRTAGVWSQQAYMKASNTGSSDQFGWSVALSGDTLAVGAFLEGSDATRINGDQTNNNAPASGAVYVFTRTGTTWSQQAYVKASNTGSGDFFGRSVALSGDMLAVGASFERSAATGIDGNQNDNSVIGAGAVYVYAK